MSNEIILSLNKFLDNNEENCSKQNYRISKGKSLIDLPADYTVIDIETTGLDYKYDEIIEIGAIKIRNRNVIETFQTLIKPTQYYFDDEFDDEFDDDNNQHSSSQRIYIDSFIEKLTGITNEMLSTAPSAIDVFPAFYDFIADDILLGHNVNFDINFLYDLSMNMLHKPISNDFVDLMRLSRKVYPHFKNHKLKTLVANLNVAPNKMHRALNDCFLTHECFGKMKTYVENENIVLSSLWKDSSIKLSEMHGNPELIDIENPFYQQHCVFTGKLELMDRRTAMQFVLDIGGFCENSVTKKTNYLILGNNDYCSAIKDGKSSKQKKAEKLKLDGQDIEIISENVFYDLIRYE